MKTVLAISALAAVIGLAVVLPPAKLRPTIPVGQ
jgi:hypothetical protein